MSKEVVTIEQLASQRDVAQKRADVLRGWITAAQPEHESEIVPQIVANQRTFDPPPGTSRERYDRRAILAAPIRLGQFREKAVPSIGNAVHQLDERISFMTAQIEGYHLAQEFLDELRDLEEFLTEAERLTAAGHMTPDNLATYQTMHQQLLDRLQTDAALRLNVERIKEEKRLRQEAEQTGTAEETPIAAAPVQPEDKTVLAGDVLKIDDLPFTPDTVIGSQVEQVVRALAPLRRDHIVTQHELAKILKIDMDITVVEADVIKELLEHANELLNPAGYRISFVPNPISFSNPGFYGEPLRSDNLSFTLLGEVVQVTTGRNQDKIAFRLTDAEWHAIWGITANRYGNFDTDVIARWLRDTQSQSVSLADLVASINKMFVDRAGAADVIVPVGNPDFGFVHKVDASYTRKDYHFPVFKTRLDALNLFFTGDPNPRQLIEAVGFTRAKKSPSHAHNNENTFRALRKAVIYLKNRSAAKITTDEEAETYFWMTEYMKQQGIPTEKALIDHIHAFIYQETSDASIRITSSDSPSPAGIGKGAAQEGTIIEVEDVKGGTVFPAAEENLTDDQTSDKRQRRNTERPKGLEGRDPLIRSRLQNILRQLWKDPSLRHDTNAGTVVTALHGRIRPRDIDDAIRDGIISRRLEGTRRREKVNIGPVQDAVLLYIHEFGQALPPNLKRDIQHLCQTIFDDKDFQRELNEIAKQIAEERKSQS